MFEFGRPSHIFDYDKIHGGLDVRWGRQGEQLKLLNGNTIEVDEKVGVIADDKGSRVAGRHHGRRRHGRVRRHEETSTSRRLLVARGRAGRSRRFNFSTDAGHRFERGVDPSQTVEHIEHITRLSWRICGGEPAHGRPGR
jgi:phenylalanyl-tRNA synthetase beta chain